MAGNNPIGQNPNNGGNPNDNTKYYQDIVGGANNKYKGYDPDGRKSELRAFDEWLAQTMYQNDWSLYMWNEQNKYNSTKEQLKRWMEAGGNPNAFFGGGTNTGNASSITSATGGGFAGTPGLGMQSLAAISDMTKTFWENKKIKAEAEKQEIENGTLNKINEATVQQIQANTKHLEKQANLTDAETKQVLEMLPYLKGKTSSEIEEINKRKENLIEQGENLKEERKKIKAETWEKLSEAYIKQWEAWYRTTYGINPEADWKNQIIQFLTGGLYQLTPAKEFDNIWSFLKQSWEDFDALMTNPVIEGDEEYYYDIKEHKYKKRTREK